MGRNCPGAHPRPRELAGRTSVKNSREQNAAIVAVTHDVRLIEGFDSVYHLSDGLLERAEANEITADPRFERPLRPRPFPKPPSGPVPRLERLGGILSRYYREAA